MPNGRTGRLQLLMIFLTVLLISAVTARAEFYKFTDSDGVIHFVDDPAKIPRQYSKKIKTYYAGAKTGSNNVTSVRIIGNQVLVPVTLGYDDRQIHATLLLDTGASMTAIDSDMFQGVSLGSSKTRSIKARIADGGTVMGSAVKVDFIEVGPNRFYNMDVALITHHGPKENHDGLLGMNFLRNCEYRIDFENQQIYWK
jgi:predicted aspartyl protease